MLQNYAQQYRDLWRRHWWWQSRRRFVLQHIHRIARRSPIDQVLDIGCGDGLMFDDLSRFGEPWGLEPDEQLLTPDGPYRDRIEVGEFNADFQPGRTFDLILMLDVLEHIDDDAAALAQVHSLLNPGGCLLLTVPALPMLWSRHDVANRHYRRYTRSHLRQRLQEAAFEVDQLGYYFGWTVGPMLMRRLLSPARKDSANGDDYAVSVPVQPVNMAMFTLACMEHRVTPSSGLPLGSSLYAVARRPDHQ